MATTTEETETSKYLRDLHNFIELNAEQLKDVFSGRFSGYVTLETTPEPIRTFLLKKDPRIEYACLFPSMNGPNYYQWQIVGSIQLPKGTTVGDFKLERAAFARVYEGIVHTHDMSSIVPPNQRQW